MLKSHIWRPIKGYEGLYLVSNTGSIKSLTREIITKKGKKRLIRGGLLKPRKGPEDYLTVILCKGGIKTTYYVHRLVASAFISIPQNATCVNHKNGKPSDNRVENLEWVTHAENVRHAYSTGLNKNKGGNHCFAAGVIDNNQQRKFATIKDWCDSLGIAYSTGRNRLARRYTKKIIDFKPTYIIPKNNSDVYSK